MSMLSDMGITVVESEEPRKRPPRRRRSEDSAEEEEQRAPSPRRAAGRHHDPRRADRPHRRSRAHVPARHGLGGAALARGRDRHRQAHRGRPRGHDRRPVREPADLPGHHHLARRAQQRQDPAARHHRSGGHLRGPRGQGRAAAHAEPGWRAGDSGAPPWPRPATARTMPPTASRAPKARCDDEDDFENAMSLAAMEAELKPKVLETFDNIAATYKKLRKLQDKQRRDAGGERAVQSRSSRRPTTSSATRSSRTSRACRSTTTASRAWSSSSTRINSTWWRWRAA